MSIYKKLFEIRHEIEGVQKDAKNPFFKSDYVTLNGLLDALNPLLKKHNVLLVQPTLKTDKENHIAIETVFIDLEAEENEFKTMFITELPLVKNDPQSAGSAITYARRYALMSFFSIKAEDDDGNEATHERKVNTGAIIAINELVEQVSSPEKLQTALGMYGVSRVEDLTQEQGANILKGLRKKRDMLKNDPNKIIKKED